MAGQLIQNMMPKLQSDSDPASDGFPLAHPDLHHGNIFVDDNHNITCIIDWGSASSVPVASSS